MSLSNKQIIEIAGRLEFDLIGFSEPQLLTHEISRLKDWIGNDYHHGMQYMTRNLEKREDITNILPEAQSIISLGINYYKNEDYSNDPSLGKVSRYAWGKDYHFIMWDKLDQFAKDVTKLDPDAKLVSYVDTGPVMDKAWAVKSGIGWMGKHTNVISTEIGSWFFIATIITNLKFRPTVPEPDRCGTCTACIDACPTGALIEDYVLDATKCISNLTIENRGDIPEEMKDKFDGWIFGCDICQDVCPWNHKKEKPAKATEFQDSSNKELNLSEVSQMTNSEFKKRYISSPINRARLKGLKRNARFIQDE